ncbi:MAG: hypothetical protein QOK36_1174 [Gaiellales bacterium]|jgi:uncharacterized membrane-anchored protein|nr:hypothetical protein [Gaiellales bacterium]
MTTVATARLSGREMLNKVPEVTLYFWIIKVLCTTVGETAADYLNTNVGLGLTKTTYLTSALLLAVLVVQFRVRLYIPPIYWLGIVLISVVGTQITDNLTDNQGVSLVTTTIVFAIVLAGVFAAWYASERTLSIHTIFTTRREAFYWLTVLFTFALGTAAGDLAAERLALGYFLSAVMFAGIIGLVTLAHYRFNLGAVTAFWLAYILTRPLGASLGDFLSQARSSGGLGLGTTVTSLIFLAAIVAVVAYLSVTRKDVAEPFIDAAEAEPTPEGKAHILVVAHRTATTPELLAAIRGRAAQGPASFHLLVPNSAEHAEMTAAERSQHHADAERALSQALPQLEAAAGGSAHGSVSIRHDPMDAVEETLKSGRFDEIILSTLPHEISRWLHIDLPRRIGALGLPTTTIIAAGAARRATGSHPKQRIS